MRRFLACVGLTLVLALTGAQTTLADGPPVLALPGTVVVTVENTTTGVATFSVSAVDGVGDPIGITCDHSSGDSFPLGTTTVTCSATDALLVTTTGTFDVVVQDPTSPTLALPSPITENVNGAASTSVTFAATSYDPDPGSPVPVTCSPPSGSSFPLGTSTVSCSATDGAGNTSNGSFTLTVQDTTPPTLTLPADITTAVDGAPTKVVTYSASASDGGTPLTPSCSPASGAAFPLGTTTVGCSVTDAGGNTVSGSFTVTVQDLTAPSVSITSGPAGTVNVRTASIGFTTSEGTTSCRLDGSGFAGCGSPASYADLADGGHTFEVRAVDAGGNTGTASRTWSIDATPPALSVPSSAVVVEADGPTGATVTFIVTGSDGGTALLPSAIKCSPSSGAKFPLGETTVACHASDGYGNVATSTFKVTVRDTTAPTINAPNASFTATSAAGIHRTDQDLASYLSRVSASDLVSTPTLTNDAPELMAVGTTSVTFAARDAAGNTSTKRATLTVLPVGRTAPPPDLTPPANPSHIVAKAGDRRVDLSWKPAAEVTSVTITLLVVGDGTSGKQVYKGSATSYALKGLKNGTTYRFVLVAFDKAGNRSKGAVVRATPKAELLLAPKPSQRVTKPPLLRWRPAAGATYYNVQLWRGKTKVLSTWPSAPRLRLAAGWTYDVKKQKLLPGTYTWYVWPGLGSRAAAHYGPLLGSRTFVVVSKQPPL